MFMFNKKLEFILFRLVLSFILADITELINLGVECSDLLNELVLGVDESLPNKLKLVEPDLVESESAIKSEKENSDGESPNFRSVDVDQREKLEKSKIDIEAMTRHAEEGTPSKKDCDEVEVIAPEARRATLKVVQEGEDSVVGTKRKASSEESPFQEFHSAPDSAFRNIKKPK